MGNENFPYSEDQSVDHPISIYGATKRNNELMAHAYSHLFKIPTTGLRFFTVYGPWGRPDMALSLFTKAILNNEPIKVYNKGEMFRSFTYIDDIIEGVFRVSNKPATSDKISLKVLQTLILVGHLIRYLILETIKQHLCLSIEELENPQKSLP